MRRLLAALLLFASLGAASAQDALVVTTCGTMPLAYSAGATRQLTVDINGKLCANNLAAGITVGTSVITSGTDTRVLFDDAGVVGESAGLTFTKATGALRSTSLALGGATIGTNSLAVTGTTLFSGAVTANASIATSVGIYPNGVSSASIGSGTGNSATSLSLASTAAKTVNLTIVDNAILQLGAANSATPTAQTFQVQSVLAGTAAASGANWTLIGSLPTGTGTSGDIIFQTGVKTATSTTQGIPTTALTLKGETQLVNAAVGFAQGANTGIVSCTASTLGATITIKGGIITAMTGC